MGKKLFVGNLSYQVDDQGLADIFAPYGTVESAKVIMDRDSGRSKGFGFVEMANDDEAATAIQKLNGSTVDRRAITVNEARPQAPRENRGGGFQRGGRY